MTVFLKSVDCGQLQSVFWGCNGYLWSVIVAFGLQSAFCGRNQYIWTAMGSFCTFSYEIGGYIWALMGILLKSFDYSQLQSLFFDCNRRIFEMHQLQFNMHRLRLIAIGPFWL